MKKNETESDDLRILSELIRDLSRLDEQEKKIRKAERTKIKAIQDVVDRLCLKLEERAEENEEISSLLQNLKETTSTLRTLLRQGCLSTTHPLRNYVTERFFVLKLPINKNHIKFLTF